MNELQTLSEICAELGIERNIPANNDVTVADYRRTGQLPPNVGNFANLYIRDHKLGGLNYQCSVRSMDLLEAYCSEDGIITVTDGRGLSYEVDVDTFIIA